VGPEKLPENNTLRKINREKLAAAADPMVMAGLVRAVPIIRHRAI
jgi:hypothetical protein